MSGGFWIRVYLGIRTDTMVNLEKVHFKITPVYGKVYCTEAFKPLGRIQA